MLYYYLQFHHIYIKVHVQYICISSIKFQILAKCLKRKNCLKVFETLIYRYSSAFPTIWGITWLYLVKFRVLVNFTYRIPGPKIQNGCYAIFKCLKVFETLIYRYSTAFPTIWGITWLYLVKFRFFVNLTFRILGPKIQNGRHLAKIRRKKWQHHFSSYLGPNWTEKTAFTISSNNFHGMT